MTQETTYKTFEEYVLASPATRRLVFQVLELAKDKDPLDAYRDVDAVARILRERFRRMIAEEVA